MADVPGEAALLAAVSAAKVSGSDYERHHLVPTVVHIGPGVFHRAHQAVYADRVLGTGSATGGIWAVSLRSGRLAEAIAGQGYRYCVVERDDRADGPERVTLVSSILGGTVAAESVEAALAVLCDPAVTVVTLTVTEDGYCASGPGGTLDVTRPEVRHDLSSPHDPHSLPGLVVEALSRRRLSGAAPLTIASCDNLPSNGVATSRVVCELAEARGGDLAQWIRATVAFPSSMVDRMVPATTPGDGDLLLRSTGIADAWPVVTEPFSQWVLEDTFPTGRPPWQRVGVELVGDVAPYENAKLRILNAAHSALAYWGLLAGHSSIAAAARDGVLAAAVGRLLRDEVLPTVVPPPRLGPARVRRAGVGAVRQLGPAIHDGQGRR